MAFKGMDDAELGAAIRASLADLAIQQLKTFKANPKVDPSAIEITNPIMVADYMNSQVHQGKLSLSSLKVTIRIPFLDIDF